MDDLGAADLPRFFTSQPRESKNVRMGTGICCDDKVTAFLNGLSTAMVEAGPLKDLPTEYEWQ